MGNSAPLSWFIFSEVSTSGQHEEQRLASFRHVYIKTLLDFPQFFRKICENSSKLKVPKLA
jgi:hypothetical protein